MMEDVLLGLSNKFTSRHGEEDWGKKGEICSALFPFHLKPKHLVISVLSADLREGSN